MLLYKKPDNRDPAVLVHILSLGGRIYDTEVFLCGLCIHNKKCRFAGACADFEPRAVDQAEYEEHIDEQLARTVREYNEKTRNHCVFI